MKKLKVGILGGTFNPIHIGHLLLAEWALDAFQLDEILFIPTGNSYMKDNIILSGEERLHMVKLAIQSNHKFLCSDIEIKRSGFTYTFETLELLKQQNPDTEYYFIVGADCLFTIETWREPERIFRACKLIAAVRDKTSLQEMSLQKELLEQKFSSHIYLLPFLSFDISSTLIRNRMKENQSLKYLVPDSVYSYIKEKHFYF